MAKGYKCLNCETKTMHWVESASGENSDVFKCSNCSYKQIGIWPDDDDDNDEES